jgi:biotin operon repressor
MLASGAYAIGAQQGDGGAVAATVASAGADRDVVEPAAFPGPPGARGAAIRARVAGPCRGGPPFGPDLEGLADKLGVSQAKLRAALRDVRPSGPPPRFHRSGRPGQDLAAALGVSESKLRAALESIRHDRRGDRENFPKALADALGIEESKVRDALEKLHADREAQHEKMRDEFAGKLADALGIPKSRVLDALPSMPHPPRHGPGPW